MNTVCTAIVSGCSGSCCTDVFVHQTEIEERLVEACRAITNDVALVYEPLWEASTHNMIARHQLITGLLTSAF